MTNENAKRLREIAEELERRDAGVEAWRVLDSAIRSGYFGGRVGGSGALGEKTEVPARDDASLPEFVLKHIEQVLEMEILGRDQIKLAKLFCFPHDPPQVGDERLVVETFHPRGPQVMVDKQLLKQLEEKSASHDELLRLLTNLVRQLDFVHASTEYKMYFVHGGRYAGPSYANELDEARAAIAKEQP